MNPGVVIEWIAYLVIACVLIALVWIVVDVWARRKHRCR